jgi:hypothetical protein
MSVEAPAPPDQHTGPFNQGEQSNEVVRSIELGGEVYETNLPEGVQLLEMQTNRPLRNATLRVMDLDVLTPGTYVIWREEVDKWADTSEPNVVSREVRLWDGGKGKVVDSQAFQNKRWTVEGQTALLMESLGYEVTKDEYDVAITGVPTPETLKAAAAEQGVEVIFFPEHDYIPGQDYLGAFARGSYPVATGEEGMYKHDIEDDHLTAMVLGGDTLKHALQKVAQRALEGGDVQMTAQLIDSFTTTLRAVIAPTNDLLGAAYGEEEGRSTILAVGGDLNIPSDEVNAIVAAAQQKAQSFGIKFTELQ